MEKTLEYKDNTFRIKKMNAIEALALQTSSSMKSVDATQSFFNECLERIEVKATDDKWLPVKQKGRNVYLPDGIENDGDAIKELIEMFMREFAKPFFKKSDESNG